MTFVLDLDDVDRAHLLAALERHRSVCLAAGGRLPPVLDRLAVSIAVRGGQRRTNPRGPVTVPDAGPATVFTISEVAGRLRVSDRTVRRLVTSGGLAAVTIAGRRRIRATDLAAYLDTLETTP